MNLKQVDRQTRRALGLVILLGVVSLLADVTYEGARSVVGPYFQVLGASAAVVGIVAGLGELVGYALRLLSGYVADRTRRYWALTIMGYTVNLLAVPALALAGRWEVAALLVILERTGKALRTPARDAILSHATSRVGRGWGFGLHEAMDQIGAILGPLVLAGVLIFGSGYRQGLAFLGIPAVMALLVLGVARWLYPRPEDLETATPPLKVKGFTRPFWLYMAAVACLAAGFVDFPLIAFHFERLKVLPEVWIPASYAAVMAVDAGAALAFGWLFDRVGFRSLVMAAVISACSAPFAFLGGIPGVVIGLVCWGVGMGAQESIMRAAVGGMVPPEKRGTAYGVFNAGYGLAWFLGSAILGILYTLSIPAMAVFSLIAQLLAIPFLLAVLRELKTR